MEFKNLYLNNKDGTSKRSFGQYPILGDIIRMLEEGIDKRKVDYIVLCLGDTLYNDYIKVIAFHTRACLKIKKYTKHLFTASFHDKIKKKGADIMLRRYELTDQEWEQVAALLPPEKTGKPGRPSKDNRTMLNGMVWIARSGAPWRDLPERYGSWNSVYSRFRKWIDDGILDNIFRVLSLEAELYELSLDATIVQAHQHSAGAKKGGLQTRSGTAGEVPAPKSMQR